MSQSSSKFCPFCGTNLSALSFKPPAQEEEPQKRAPARSSFVPFSNEDDDDDSYIDRMDRLHVNISKLDIEFGEIPKSKDTIGGLMAQGPTNEEGRGRSIFSEQEILENFKKEGSALRPVSKSRQNSPNEE
jgi:hypothetical protein